MCYTNLIAYSPTLPLLYFMQPSYTTEGSCITSFAGSTGTGISSNENILTLISERLRVSSNVHDNISKEEYQEGKSNEQ